MLPLGVRQSISTSGQGSSLTLGSISGYGVFTDQCQVGEYVDCIISDGNNWQWCILSIGSSTSATIVYIYGMFSGGTWTARPAVGAGLSLSGSAVVAPGIVKARTPASLNRPLLTNVTNPGVISSHLSGNGTSNGIAAQTLHAFPFVLKTGGVLQGFQANVITAQAGATFSLGLYQMENGWIGKLLSSASGLDGSTTGVKTGAASQTLELEPGVYAVATLQETAGSVIALRYLTQAASPWGVSGTDYITQISIGSVLSALPSTFPTTSPTVSSSSTAGIAPTIALVLG